jgi:SAM-dependent methyltransferase
MRIAVLLPLLFSARLFPQEMPAKYPDVPYVPMPVEVIDELLKLANIQKSDVVYDLGCGDGRIVIAAARKYGAAATGIDIDPDLVRDARENAAKAGVEKQVTFQVADFFTADIRPATVVTLYLLPAVNAKLKPKLLRDLRPGTRVLSFRADMGDWKPNKTVEVNGRPIYLWVIPERPN